MDVTQPPALEAQNQETNPDHDQEQHLAKEWQLWRDWKRTGQPDLHARLFFMHGEWVRSLASFMYSRYPHPLAEWADYQSLASLGQLQAMQSFDPDRQLRFRTFAEPHVKGAVLKGLSCYIKDQRPVQRDRLSNLDSTDRFAETDADLEMVVNAAVDLAFGYFLELGVLDQQPVDNDPLSLYSQASADSSLVQLLEQLPEREQQVMVGHYYQQLSFASLSTLLGVSKARVSQLHRQALKRIRTLWEDAQGAGQW